MPIEPRFLQKLVCPKTHQPLRAANADELARVNRAIERHAVQTVGGKPVDEPLEEGLVPSGASIVYPVRGGIPVMLAEEAIPLSS